MFTSIRDYMDLLKNDLSREAGLNKKILLESLTGLEVRNNNFLTRLAEEIGARKNSVFESAKRRGKMESESKLLPIVARLQRKSPEGDKFISLQWKVEAFGLYDSHLVSDVVKGVNNVHKVKFII